jgi:hypothetical protein
MLVTGTPTPSPRSNNNPALSPVVLFTVISVAAIAAATVSVVDAATPPDPTTEVT